MNASLNILQDGPTSNVLPVVIDGVSGYLPSGSSLNFPNITALNVNGTVYSGYSSLSVVASTGSQSFCSDSPYDFLAYGFGVSLSFLGIVLFLAIARKIIKPSVEI